MNKLEWIRATLDYLNNDKKFRDLCSERIDMNLLFEIRKYIKDNPQIYKELFPKAREYDEKIRNNKEKLPYTHDGCLYEIDNEEDRAFVKECILYESGDKMPLKFMCDMNVFRGKRYFYINELDHWISYLIIGYLNDPEKRIGSNLEYGLRCIKEEILKVHR